MTSNCNQRTNVALAGYSTGKCMRFRSIALACLLSSSMLLGACTTAAPKSSGGTSSPAQAGIEAADTAYYFDVNRKLVAVEALSGPARKIKKSIEFANEDGANLVFESQCQGSLPTFGGVTEMIGKASLAVYAIAAPEGLTVLGVEDLQDVPSRKILPLKGTGSDGGGVCNCALKRCGPVKCCPCP